MLGECFFGCYIRYSTKKDCYLKHDFIFQSSHVYSQSSGSERLRNAPPDPYL
jgi:hypothetical protein